MDDEGVIKKIGEDYVELERYFDAIKGIESYDDFPKFKENPFLCLLMDQMKLTWKTKGVLNGIGSVEYVDKDTGQIVSASENRVFRRKEYVDSGTFTKMYYSQMKILFSLSGTTIKVFGYFIQQMDESNENGKVYFRLKECMDFLNLRSRASIYSGLRELITRGFICKTDIPWQFFVNPLYVFKGNRLVIFNEYIRQDFFETTKQIGE